MPRVKSEPAEDSKRLLVFDARVEEKERKSGRSVSGLLSIHYGQEDIDHLLKNMRNDLPSGKYRLVYQMKRRGRWVHVASEERIVNAAPS